MVGSEVYSSEVKKTEVLMENFRCVIHWWMMDSIDEVEVEGEGENGDADACCLYVTLPFTFTLWTDGRSGCGSRRTRRCTRAR